MSLNPAAKRLISRYRKLSSVDKERFLERTTFNYNDQRFVHSLVDWAAENNSPTILEKILHDANTVNNTDLIGYVVNRIYHNRTTLERQTTELFHAWVGASNFNCERVCVHNTEVWDLKWIHNLTPHIKNDDVRYLAYKCVVDFCTPVTIENGFFNAATIIKPYCENLISCLISEPQCEDMIARLHSDCKPSIFLETVSCGAQKQRLQLHVGEAFGIVVYRKI